MPNEKEKDVDLAKVPVEDTKPSTSMASVSEANTSKPILKSTTNNSSAPLKEFNVLLLGETGVGKSTFINSIGNYLHFKTFDKALNANELLVLINSQFNVIDEDNEHHTVIVQETYDENESIGGGQSQTQDVKPYVFPILDNTCKIRLIDTPGMGDTRGFDQDDINCEKILNYIANLDELHGLCFLLKPTNTRITPSFKYCLKKILSNLDKSAANNIVFCFTNTRASNFEPGETEECLRKLIGEIKNAVIPFDRNSFCFDNESFKYLAAIKQNIHINETVVKNAQFSWETSTEQALSFMEYIKALEPHIAKNTVCINEARNTITQLSKPLADITECLDANIKQLREHERILNDKNQSLSDLQKNLHVPTIDLIIEEIDHPATVCTNISCIELIKIGTFKKINFKHKCHPHCYLNGVTKEFVGDPILRDCWAMRSEFCHQCGCHYTKHMHIYYVTNVANIQAVNRNVESEIKTEKDLLEEKEKIITQCRVYGDELRSEYEMILNTIAKFAHFLKHHAITPFNDAYKEYINYLIQQEEDLGDDKDEEVMIALNSTLKKYEDYKIVFENAFKSSSDTVLALTPERIHKMRDELFTLKHSGLKIRKMFNLQNSGKKDERSYEEYVYNGQTSQKKKNSTNPLNDVNIILLGETGVGKSTFINSVANYLQFGDFENVMDKKQILAIIPVEFNYPDKFKKKHTVKLGDKDNNEYLNTGDSATQEVKSYVFPLPDSDKRIRLIDTPGLGDTRGTFQDEQNCENILGYIGQMGSIHAFCFLFKPTETRVRPAFIYCIKKILTHLDKSAARNMIFCFTNSRGSNYQAGESEETIKRIIKDIKNKSKVEIPYKNNVFYFDNEGFRVMAAFCQGVQLTDAIIATACSSWTVSFDSCISMFKYIIGDNDKRGLYPHDVTSTVCVNEARKKIMKLSQPLADIAQFIDNQIRRLEKHKQKLNLDNQTLDELRANLYIPFTDLKVSKLDAPATVCCSAKCTEVYEIDGVKTTHYKDPCHGICFLKDVTKEIVGDHALLKCEAFLPADGNCRYCGCHYRTHMHVYYKTEVYSTTVQDKAKIASIESTEALIEECERVTEEIKVFSEEYKKEYEFVIEVTAKFAHFLQTNAITPFNDAHKEYINQLIMNEKSMGEDADTDKIKSLQDSITKHEQMIKAFENALKKGKTLGNISPNEINSCMLNIFKMKHFGEKIKNMFEAQGAARNYEYKQKEYLHPNACHGYNKKRGQKKNNQSVWSKGYNFVMKRVGWNQSPSTSNYNPQNGYGPSPRNFKRFDYDDAIRKCELLEQLGTSNTDNAHGRMSSASRSNEDNVILIQLVDPNDPTKCEPPFYIPPMVLNSLEQQRIKYRILQCAPTTNFENNFNRGNGEYMNMTDSGFTQRSNEANFNFGSPSKNQFSTSENNYDTNGYNFGRRNEENYQGKSAYDLAGTSYTNGGNVANDSYDYNNYNQPANGENVANDSYDYNNYSQRAMNSTFHDNTRMSNNSYPMMSNNYFGPQSFNQPPLTPSDFGRYENGKDNNNMPNFTKAHASNDQSFNMSSRLYSQVTSHMSLKVEATNDLPSNLMDTTESIENNPSEYLKNLNQPKKRFICKFHRMLQDE